MSQIWQAVELDALKKLSDHGATIDEAARIIKNRTPGGIQKMARKRGWPLKDCPDPEIDEAALMAFLKGKN